jgi:hypothetical protein
LDTAAEAFGDYLEWSEHLHMQASTEVESERHRLEHDGGWSPPRLGMAEAIEQSAKMAERAHTRFLRTVKMLHELQRSAPTLFVGQAGQINVGTQQVNVGTTSGTPSMLADPPSAVGAESTPPPDDFDKSSRRDDVHGQLLFNPMEPHNRAAGH